MDVDKRHSFTELSLQFNPSYLSGIVANRVLTVVFRQSNFQLTITLLA